MAGNVRQRMIDGALDLLSRRGLQPTSFAEVTQATSTPRGSIYHHFPGGKQELVLEALDASAEKFRTDIGRLPRTSPEEFTQELAAGLRRYTQDNNFTAGGPATAVTVAAENSEQLLRSATVFDAVITSATQAYVEMGVGQAEAKSFATLVAAALVGANTFARATRSIEPIDAVSSELIEKARTLKSA